MRAVIENIKVAFKSLNSNKLRGFLTMLGIIIGVGAVVAVISVGEGAKASITENISSIGTNVITISPGREMPQGGMMGRAEGGQSGGGPGGNGQEDTVNPGELYLEDVDVLKKEASLLDGVVPVVSGRNSTFKYGSTSGNVSVTGTTENYLDIEGYTVEMGNFFTGSDVSNWSNCVVLGNTVASDYFGMVNPIGETVKINGQNFIVIGVLQSLGSSGFGESADNGLFIPITTAQHKLYGVKTVDSIAARVKDSDNMDQAEEQITSILRRQHKILPDDYNDFELRSATQFLEMASSVTEILTITLTSIAAISLLVGGIGIMNIMFVSVTERTREIGIRKAVGAKNKDILIQFLTEAIILSLSGGVIGIGLALLISWGLKTFTSLNSVITAVPIMLALSFSTAIGLIFGIFPAMRAARLNPIESLRYE
jgi:putative ABC transport system permease protein